MERERAGRLGKNESVNHRPGTGVPALAPRIAANCGQKRLQRYLACVADDDSVSRARTRSSIASPCVRHVDRGSSHAEQRAAGDDRRSVFTRSRSLGISRTHTTQSSRARQLRRSRAAGPASRRNGDGSRRQGARPVERPDRFYSAIVPHSPRRSPLGDRTQSFLCGHPVYNMYVPQPTPRSVARVDA